MLHCQRKDLEVIRSADHGSVIMLTHCNSSDTQNTIVEN